MSGTVVNTPISARAPTPGEIAAKKLNSMVDTDDEQIAALLQAACRRVLTLSEQRVSHIMDLPHLRWTFFLVADFAYEFLNVHELIFQQNIASALQYMSIQPHINAFNLTELIERNPTLGYVATIALLKGHSSDYEKQSEHFDYLDALRRLPAALPSFDVMGRLLRDQTVIQGNSPDISCTVADIIRSEVLGGFLLNCMNWIEHAEQEALNGFVSDDRVAKSIQNVSTVQSVCFLRR